MTIGSNKAAKGAKFTNNFKCKRVVMELEGLRVGHFTNGVAYTGCTVVLCENGVVCGVDIRGGAPGTRETQLLQPTCRVDKVNAILLTGGSAVGLAAADGVMRYLIELGHGYDAGARRIPIVPAAVIFDYYLGSSDVAPSAEDGYRACLNATAEGVENGSIGAGTGATVGKVCGLQGAMRGGLGTSSIKFKNGLVVWALMVVNAFGDVRDVESNKIIAGARAKDNSFVNAVKYLMDGNSIYPHCPDNTTIGVVATNAVLDKAQATCVARMAQTGLAQVVAPCHTMFDGDTIFALSTCEVEADLNFVGVVASEVVKEAIVSAVKSAKSAGDVLGYSG